MSRTSTRKQKSVQKSLKRFSWKWVGFIVSFICLVIFLIVAGTMWVRAVRSTKIDSVQGYAPKLLVLGIDGGDWDIIDPLIEEGKMPNLQRLIEEGVSATPKTLNPTISPAIWTTAATGKYPEKHGIRNFIMTSEEYEIEYVSSELRRSKALWNIFDSKGWSVGLFSWWATWPPEKLKGYNVSDFAAIDRRGGVWPEDLGRDMEEISLKTLGFAIFSAPFKLKFPVPLSVDDAAFFQAAYQIVHRLDVLFNANSLYAFDRYQPDVMMQIFGGTDAAQHLFLKFHDPSKYPSPVDPELQKKYGTFIQELYINQDVLLGEYMKRAGPDTHVIAMSDHGVFVDPAAGYRFTGFNLLLAHLNLLQYLPDGEIDFSRTLAFECNNNTFDWQRRLCINVKGQYAGGIVELADTERVRAQVIERLRSVRTVSGKPFLLSIQKSTDIANDVEYDISREIIDDTLVVEGTRHPVKEYLTLSVESGNHYSDPLGPDGFFIWKGPNIRSGVTVDLDYVDIAPNILHALGLPIARDMDGVYRPELFTEATEPEYIDTYENGVKHLPVTRVESFEPDDKITMNGLEFSVRSNVSRSGEYDRACIQVPETGYVIDALHVRRLEAEEITASDTGEGHSDPIPFMPITDIEAVPVIRANAIPLSSLVFADADLHAYRNHVPLDFATESYLGIWTNSEARFMMPEDGYLHIVARGTPAKGGWPELRFIQEGSEQSVVINSLEAHVYTVKLSQGLVRLAYRNDDKGASEDRNVYIQRMSYDERPIQILPALPTFERIGSDFCYTNTVPGTVIADFRVRPALSNAEHTEASQEAIDFLQETGQIEGAAP